MSSDDKKINQETEDVKKKAQKFDIPFKSVEHKKIPPDVLKSIPKESVDFYRFIPIGKKDGVLEVGLLDPENLQAKEALRFIGQRNDLDVETFLITPSGFKNVLKQYENLQAEVKKALKELEEDIASKKKSKEVSSKKSGIKKRAEEISAPAPVSKIVAVILKHAAEGRASDIHIEPTQKDKIKVRFRVDGLLHTGLYLPAKTHSAIVSRVKILAELQIDETRVPQDGRFHTVINGKDMDFRVSIFPVSNGEKVVLRVLDPDAGLKCFKELGLTGYNLETLEHAITEPFGMILISGPTGSGKTTTLYSILKKINQEKINIVSLEDPVEYYMEGVNQSQIKPEIGYTFVSGLRHILRQDPDVVMVGEIRDEETAGLAIHAALTGHILLSTIHTNDAIGVIPRLIDMGIGSFLIPSAVNLAIAQRLTRRLCPDCRKKISAPARINEVIREELTKLKPEQRKGYEVKSSYEIYRPVGCKRCGDKGTKGRIAVYEMLKMTHSLESIINENPEEAPIKEEARRQGMVTMEQDGIMKVLDGLISFEEMLRTVEE